ncbi:hypothetical protein JCM19231_898 [Vibrio ishigakensis]|uniref:Uncharacterized protein n=1 Tax=Vibrio ishigakensis TaxID=1481914 RepID=A0A0B8NWY1_9VIBR|nr:hypothetical protein JCM19231_898 [Vibrio ishigakensis]
MDLDRASSELNEKLSAIGGTAKRCGSEVCSNSSKFCYPSNASLYRYGI